MNKRPTYKKKYSRHMVKLVAFCVLATVFTAIFSAAHGNNSVALPDRHIATVSAKNKRGVTMPKGVTIVQKNKGTDKKIGNIITPVPGSTTTGRPAWTNMPLFTDPSNSAAQYLIANPAAKGSQYIARMSQTPVAQWFGDWNGNVQADVNSYVSAAASKGRVPVVVVYNIPNRDCGGYSVGGAASISSYTQWVKEVAAGIGNRVAVVVLEPDALGALDCLPASIQKDRLQSLSQAVSVLKANASTSVYLDAGTPVWQPLNVMSSRLKSANVAAADGFSLNVSYFATTALNQSYGDQLASLVGNKHYVIDTSRNGGNNTVTGMQCNPSFASIGETPTTNTGKPLNDGLLWIKIPWESDGACNGSPGPGQEYWDYAILLAQNAGW